MSQGAVCAKSIHGALRQRAPPSAPAVSGGFRSYGGTGLTGLREVLGAGLSKWLR
jgi:hypothetical protein